MINRAQFGFVYYGLVLIVMAAIPAVAQRDYSKVQIETTKLTEQIYMLKGAGGNIGVCVGDDDPKTISCTVL